MKEILLRIVRAFNRLGETHPDNTSELDQARAEAKAAVQELSEFKATTQAEKDAQALTPDEQAEVDEALDTIGNATPEE